MMIQAFSNHFAQQLQDNVDGQMLMIYELTQNMGSDTYSVELES